MCSIFAPLRAIALLLAGAILAGASPAPQPQQTVVFYASFTAPELNGIVAGFAQAHPEIKVDALRLTSALIPPRIVTAQRAGRFDVDVISAGAMDTAELVAAKALQRYPNAEQRHFLRGTVDPNGLWSALYIGTTVIAWNTERLKAANLRPPASLADFQDPRWNGKIGMDDAAFTWYLGTLHGGAQVKRVMQGIAANKPLLVSSHSLMMSQLVSGEFDVTPTAYGYLADIAKRKGAPIDYVNPSPLIFQASTVAIAKNAPHLAAARTLVDWLLSKPAQQILTSLRGGDYCSPRADVASNGALCNTASPHVIVGPQDATSFDDVVRDYKSIFGIAD